MFAKRLLACLTVSLALGLAPSAPDAAESTLTIIDAKGDSHAFPIDTLLKHPQAVTVTVKGDPAYGEASPAYRAVPLTALLKGLPVEDADVLMATALDGFVAQLPARKALNAEPSGAVAYLAVEDPAKPWPNLKGREVTAGPYFLVWANPEKSGIGPESWPYQAIRFEFKESVAKRYPAVLAAEDLAADDPARRGQELFVENCFVCHQMNGNGEATVGPDLNLPMNPTEYFQPAVLPRYLRDPSSVRTWADQKMPGFAPDVLNDQDVAAIVAYLGHMAGRKAK